MRYALAVSIKLYMLYQVLDMVFCFFYFLHPMLKLFFDKRPASRRRSTSAIACHSLTLPHLLPTPSRSEVPPARPLTRPPVA